MKLSEIANAGGKPLTEEKEYSDEFAQLILNEQAKGEWTDMDPDEFLAETQRIIDGQE